MYILELLSLAKNSNRRVLELQKVNCKPRLPSDHLVVAIFSGKKQVDNHIGVSMRAGPSGVELLRIRMKQRVIVMEVELLDKFLNALVYDEDQDI